MTVNDIPGSNVTGLGNDELVFANGTVTSVGQIIAIVLAKDKLIAQRAVRNIDINYTDLPSVLTIEVYIRYYYCCYYYCCYYYYYYCCFIRMLETQNHFTKLFVQSNMAIRHQLCLIAIMYLQVLLELVDRNTSIWRLTLVL